MLRSILKVNFKIKINWMKITVSTMEYKFSPNPNGRNGVSQDRHLEEDGQAEQGHDLQGTR
jgi:hypothetical protein